jgi:thymidine phosphorylase
MHSHGNTLTLKQFGIDTYRENIIFMRVDCPICQLEGFKALTRILVQHKDKSIIATLNVVESEMLAHGEVILSNIGCQRLGAQTGDIITLSHLPAIESLSDVRAKMYGTRLSQQACWRIMKDLTAGMYSNIEIAAFITACAGTNLDLNEITALTEAMIATGQRIDWDGKKVMDKHCVGGLPGNRTTPLVVSIIAAAGLLIPKTSSRAITSPAGTADTVEVLTPVEITIEQMRDILSKESGCLAWGGSMQLSPADDILISVERALNVDSEGQMIASVLSKKAAAGATHVVIDIPVGPTAKVRTIEEASRLDHYFTAVGRSLGLEIKVMITDGIQPVGRGIGPALEAMDILSVLRNEVAAPQDLRERSLSIAAALLELSQVCRLGEGYSKAVEILNSGKALDKFMRICAAQGGFKEPVYSAFRKEITANESGKVVGIDNRRLARLAKLAGAPQRPAAGIRIGTKVGDEIKKGQVLFTIYAETPGELEYALEYYTTSGTILDIR